MWQKGKKKKKKIGGKLLVHAIERFPGEPLPPFYSSNKEQMWSPSRTKPTAGKRPASSQLVKTLRNHEEDVNGRKLTPAMIAERMSALYKCGDVRRNLEAAATDQEQGKIIVQATELFRSIGTTYEDVDRRKEAFLCIARSGLLSLCVGIALKAHEDIGDPPSKAMAECGRILLTPTNLEGARGVTEVNWVRCTKFVDHHMMDHSFAKHIARNWNNLLRRWTVFLEHKPYREDYCRRCLVDTTVSTFIRKAAEGTPGWAYHARQDLIKALQEYKEPEKKAEEKEGEEEEWADDDSSIDDRYDLFSSS